MKKSTLSRLLKACITTGALLTIAACSSSGDNGSLIETEAKYPTGADRDGSTKSIYDKAPSIFGDGGLSIGGDKKQDNEDGASGIGVNSFLWRASLDTVSFMPLASADPFGGVILTDWYTPDASKGERFKVNVFIMGRQLRSDGVRVRVFRQLYSGGTWRDAAASDATARQLEDTILTRARQLRVAQLD
ncbi:MAG: DUF3576 domain-containing protein [Alphaproteobacteria bacterium]|nr:DUF3576 domain-containing protein [Alphaproteobacteria bacterium]